MPLKATLELVFFFILIGIVHSSTTTKTSSFPLPKIDEIYFYVLTFEGTFLTKETHLDIHIDTSKWSSLFNNATKLIKQLDASVN